MERLTMNRFKIDIRFVFLGFVSALLAFYLNSCAGLKMPEQVKIEEVKPLPVYDYKPLSLENKLGKDIGKYIIEQIEYNYPILKTAKDIQIFCNRKLNDKQQINVLAEVISQMSYYESSWNPKTDYTESSMGIDKVTGKQVVSTGLLQLSYQDTQWYKDEAKRCGVDYKKSNLYDAKVNLCFGIGIMTKLVKNKSKIVLTSPYWSVIRDPSTGKKTKLDQIVKASSASKACLNEFE